MRLARGGSGLFSRGSGRHHRVARRAPRFTRRGFALSQRESDLMRRIDARLAENPGITDQWDRGENLEELRSFVYEAISEPVHMGAFRRRSPRAEKFHRVASEADVVAVIQEAIRQSHQVRAVGSLHSVESAIHADSGSNLKLVEKLSGVSLIGEGSDEHGKYGRFKVGAGCHLGFDPADRDHSTEGNSLINQIEAAGYGLPIVGGITHQTLAGFMQTGSAGGSTQHGFADAVESIRFVNGKGNLVEAHRGQDLFNAVGVSMGMFGVITEVTLKLRPSYWVSGAEVVKPEDKSVLALASSGQYKLEHVLENAEYFHANWFPQEGVNRVLEWSCERSASRIEQPYENPLEGRFEEFGASLLFRYVDYMRRSGDFNSRRMRFVKWLMRKFFVPVDDVQEFNDVWYKTIPTENKVDVDDTIKTLFTEIWLPTNQTTKAINILKELYEDPYVAWGNFAIELYGAKASPFWLSPSYGRDVIRLDPYWWAKNKGDPAEFFTHFWDRLLELPGARLHWGKYMPRPGQQCGNVRYDASFLHARYPRLTEWMRLRKEMDPHQVFVTDYWRGHFAIPAVGNPEPASRARMTMGV